MPGMDPAKGKELWDRLANEPERAYGAFEPLALTNVDRTILQAYKCHVGNPEAAKSCDG